MTSNDNHVVVAATTAASSAVAVSVEDTVVVGVSGSEVLDYHMAASTSNQKINLADIEAKWKDVPDKYFIIIAHFLAGHINDTEAMDRFSGPILKASIKSVYWLFLIQYAALAMLGVLMNVAIIAYVLYHRLYKDVTHAFIINLAFCHTVQCAVVLPISLMVMLIQNWIFGQFLCFFLPMLQDIPLHVAMISHILIAWDRMRWLSDPLKDRLPAFVCCCATWLTGMVIALPYPIYTIYVELGDYVARLSGMGLCVVNLMDDMHEYTRGLFLIMYCAPAILLAYLYIRTSQELRPPEGPFAVMMYEHRADVRIRQRNSSASSVERNTGTAAGLSRTTSAHSNSGHATTGNATTSTRSYDLYSAELDVHREKRKQRNYGTMAAVQVVCICPLMVLRFARLSLEETYENQKHFDFTYLMFVWIAFLPTVIFPCMYASQILPRDEQERLRGYFRLSSKSKSRRTADGNGNDTGRGHGDANAGNAERKEGQTNNSTSLVLDNGDGYALANKNENAKSLKSTTGRDQGKGDQRHGNRDKDRHAGTAYRHGKDKYRNSAPLAGRGAADAGVVNNLGKDMRSKKHDVKINIISDGQAQSGRGKGAASARQQQHRLSQGGSTISSRQQRKLTIESTDNNSCSNYTASTFCNDSTGMLLDDSSTSNYGDGEESSVVSSMMVPNSSHLARWNAGGLNHKDVSFSECSSTFSRMDSPSSTLERDLDIIDRLERERSMDIQEMIEREKRGEKVRLSGERRLLPDIEKLYAQRSPKLGQKHDPYSYDKTMTMTPLTGSGGSKDMHIQMLSTSVLPGSDPLSSLSHHSESYSLASTLSDDLPHDSMLLEDLDEEEVPQDFYDNYTPGANTTIPPLSKVHPSAAPTTAAVAVSTSATVSASAAAAAAAANNANAAVAAAVAASAAVPSYQYQYTRRLSRKASHHSSAGVVGLSGSSSSSSHRVSKRDSFNSLNGTDLIAGAFGELDPTQPLNKMSVIEGRMRRSSPRNSSFSSSSARSSLKSRDYGHGSTHSAHPELDFRENIFAEL